jgi:hypothetical protein
MWILGIYDERYERTAAGWRIKTMRFISAANAPYSLGWAKKPDA